MWGGGAQHPVRALWAGNLHAVGVAGSLGPEAGAAWLRLAAPDQEGVVTDRGVG